MPQLPDLTDPRYLDEVGWFLYHAKYARDILGESYDQERLTNSRIVMEEVLRYCQQEENWLRDKTVVSIGCGCTGDLAVWPAACKIAVDPLLYAYQKLEMLLEDAPGTSRTINLSLGVEDLPLLDDCADLVLCRNALDHMPDAKEGLKQIWRILKTTGNFFLSVDIGGEPTPDEPTVFSLESLSSLLEDLFDLKIQDNKRRPHSHRRPGNTRIVARKKTGSGLQLNKEELLQAYVERMRYT